jgi:hypothetical protein
MWLKERGWERVDWIQLAQVKGQLLVVLNIVMNLQAPLNGGNFLPSYRDVRFFI